MLFWLQSLRFRDGSYQLYSGSFDRTIKQWNLEDMMYLDTLYGHQAEIIGLDCDNRERPVTVSRDHTCRLWKVMLAIALGLASCTWKCSMPSQVACMFFTGYEE